MEEVTDDISEFIKKVKSFSPISNTTFDVNKEENKDLKEDNKAWKKLEERDKETDIRLKLFYGIFIIVVLLMWEIFVIYLSIKQLNPCDKCVRKLSDPVFIALLTTTTANILALPTIVIKYLFPHYRK